MTIGNWIDSDGNRSRSMPSEEQNNVTGLRNPSSSTSAYIPIRNEANATIIAVQTAVQLGGGAANDSHLIGLHIHTALTGTCVVSGMADSAGAVASYTIPASTVGHIPFYGAKNSAGALTVTCSNAGDASKVVAFWRPA